MRRLIDRWSLSVIILFSVVKFLQFIRRSGLAYREDGWRKATRVFLRTEESKFILAAFRLSIWRKLESAESNDLNHKKTYLINKLSDFLRNKPNLHWRLQWDRFSVKSLKADNIDLVHAGSDEDGCLYSIVPYLDRRKNTSFVASIDPELKNTLHSEFIKVYNATKDLDDKIRPIILKKKLNNWISTQLEAINIDTRKRLKYYTDRILSAIFIHFEEIASQETRFDCPAFIKRKHPGFNYLNIICRHSKEADEVDLWFQCNHAPIDGVPIQRAIKELENLWGLEGKLILPSLSYNKTAAPKLISTKNSKKGVYQISHLIDFRPFLEKVKDINRQNSNHIITTPLRFLVWKLGNHKAFGGRKFLIPVHLPEYNGRDATLGFVLIRPSTYFDGTKSDEGLFAFQKEFHRQVKSTLARNSESYELLEDYAVLPPALYSLTLRLMPSGVKELIGSVGFTVINKANVFISPFSDVHTDGFIAFGNFFIPTADRKPACYISIKGPREKIDDYLTSIKNIANGS